MTTLPRSAVPPTTALSVHCPVAELPDVAVLGARARVLYDMLVSTSRYPQLRGAVAEHLSNGAWHNGLLAVARWNTKADGPLLFQEGLRMMCLGAAVLELASESAVSQLPTPGPIEAMVQAIASQFAVLVRLQMDTAMFFPLPIRASAEDYVEGCFTDQAYAEAAWGTPDRRYWVNHQEYSARVAKLAALYESIGVYDGGRRHDITFSD